MSIESVIGITSGVIGIVGGVYGGCYWLKKRLEKRPISEVFVQLVDKKIQDLERREWMSR